ncbi:hypothetical protein EXM22_07865 [Oceanispirochaeta crateris]|jgi:hypothetical protein|uniref:Cell division protein FtsL n=1 Tax=Oceanispirochaeta crateris TaxID=2518645 RepID=A0A5C1QKR0_9SPIO|nr:hypothetical protein [Oceanispirochaeta crateris]QEN07908.1 hypothetical protein EXM22_07865 [Oceanispirochaeta crateris]
MLKKAITFCFLLLFPVFLCLNVWQSFRYQQLQADLVTLQKKQLDLIEKNKRALAAVAVYSSPSRVGALAEDSPDLKKADAEDIILLQKGEE